LATSSRKIYGFEKPRLWTPPLRPLTRRTSLGYEIADFAAEIGSPFLPWQRWTAIHAMELLPGGLPRFRTILILVARQNGKSNLKRTISLWQLYKRGARLIIGIAQDVDLAREQMDLCVETIEDCPALEAELRGVRRVNGSENFRLKGGGRYKIKAANRRAGRGLAGVTEVNIDELREQTDWRAWGAVSKTTMAVANAQIWAMSNAGDDSSVVLNQLRDAALSGRDPSIFLAEYSAPDNCELDDPKAWRQANPALGHLITEQAIRSAMGTDPPAVFRTEVLCQRVDQLDGAIDLAAWNDCEDRAGTMDGLRNRIAAVFDVAEDGQHASLLAAAKLDDGRVRIEVVKAWGSTDEARTELEDLLARVKPAAFGWYSAGPGAALAPLLRRLALKYNKRPGKRDWKHPETGEITGGTVAEACQGLASLTLGRRIVHPADPLLNAHIGGATKLNAADGWRFTRRGGGHADAAYAAAGAVHIALTMPEVKRARLRMLG